MASRNANLSLRNGPYESGEKLPSSTLKRHPKMELNKNDLLRLLSYLEGELQARDITIAALKTEKAKQLLYQAKYGRFGLGDPFHALQRDSEGQKDTSFDEAAIKAMYDNQLGQLENLIATQRKAQHRMREQLASVEKRYHKVCSDLEEERRKHAQDTAEGDDVTYMLEKERERLKQEVEFEKTQNKKLEKEVKKLSVQLKEEKVLSHRHKQVALLLIKESQVIAEKMSEAQYVSEQAERVVRSERDRSKVMEEGLSSENQRAQTMEAAMEKQALEFDVEREQMKHRLSREQTRNSDLLAEIQQLKAQLEQPKSSVSGSGNLPHTHTMKLNSKYQGTDTPPHTPPEMRKAPVPAPRSDLGHQSSPEPIAPRRRGGGAISGATIANKSKVSVTASPPSGAIQSDSSSAATVACQPASSRLNIVSSSGTVLSSPSGGTTVFTTPSGTRISLNVGPSQVTSTRKPSGSGLNNRGTPPPVPPNKPVGVLATPNPRTKTPNARAVPVHHQTGSTSRVQTPTKFGITISKDKITISGGPDSMSTTTTTTTSSAMRAISTTTSSNVGKPSQVCAHSVRS